MQKKYITITLALSCTLAHAQLSVSELFYALVRNHAVCQPLLATKNRPASGQQDDVYMLSRLLKESAKHSCVLVTKSGVDESLINTLFPQAIVHIADSIEQTNNVVNHIACHDLNETYGILFTNLGQEGEAFTKAVQRRMPNVSALAVDTLFSAEDNTIDMPKLMQLMKRRIHVFCSSALIPKRWQQRQNQYVRSIEALISYGYYPYVAESCAAAPTFFDAYTNRVFYTLSNNASLNNKGVNESVSLLLGLQQCNFADEDIILKITGRYFLQSDYIIRMLEDNPEIEALAKFVPITDTIDAVLTGCFALRFDRFKEMLATFDYDKMEREMICVEYEVAAYLNREAKNGLKVMRTDRLDMEANMFGIDGSDELTYW